MTFLLGTPSGEVQHGNTILNGDSYSGLAKDAAHHVSVNQEMLTYVRTNGTCKVSDMKE